MHMLAEFELVIGSELYLQLYSACLKTRYESDDRERLYLQKFIQRVWCFVKFDTPAQCAFPVVDLVINFAKKCDGDLEYIYLLYCVEKRTNMMCLI